MNCFLHTLIKCLALFRSPKVVCLELSAPTGTMSFSFSRQWRKWARLFFSSSLWVDLKLKMKQVRFMSQFLHNLFKNFRKTYYFFNHYYSDTFRHQISFYGIYNFIIEFVMLINIVTNENKKRWMNRTSFEICGLCLSLLHHTC